MVVQIGFMWLRDLVLQHIVWALPIAAIVFAVLMPSAALAVFRFLTGTTAGQILTALVVAGLVGWFGRGMVDDLAMRRRDIIAARDATKAAEAAKALADARLDELRREVAASNLLTAIAKDQADANEAAVALYQRRETDYEDRLAKAGGAECVLGPADIVGLRGAAAVYRRDGATADPARPRKLRPAHPGS